MKEERDEHAIWVARWEGRRVDTPDGIGICTGFNDEGTGVTYQVKTINPHGVKVWKDYPRAKVTLRKEKI